MDYKLELNRLVDSGKFIFGYNEVVKATLNGKGKGVVVCEVLDDNKKTYLRKICEKANLKYREIGLKPKEMGAACRRPHPILTLLVEDEGLSKILE